MNYEFSLPVWFWPLWGCLVIFYLFVWWRIFEKAGRPGWESLIPFYNLYIIATKISGRPGWWLLMLLVPFANIYYAIVLVRSYARSFGQGVGFTVGLIFLGGIFNPIIAFGNIRYVGPNGVSGVAREDIDAMGNN